MPRLEHLPPGLVESTNHLVEEGLLYYRGARAAGGSHGRASLAARQHVRTLANQIAGVAAQALSLAMSKGSDSLPGADWTWDDYRGSRTPLEIRADISDMCDRYSSPDDLLDKLKSPHAMRTRLFVSGLTYTEVAVVVGVSVSAVRTSVLESHQRLRRLGRQVIEPEQGEDDIK